nr:hypothetical protein [Fodinicola feengrottensis]
MVDFFLSATEKCPGGVARPARPVRIGVGPKTTFPALCTHMVCEVRSTQTVNL